MPVKSVKLEVISADPNEYNSYIITSENLLLLSQGGKENFPSNPNDPDEIYSYNVSGGTGGSMVIGITTFNRAHYPENLEDIEDTELREFVSTAYAGQITSSQLISPGFGYIPGDRVEIAHGKATASYSFQNVQLRILCHDI